LAEKSHLAILKFFGLSFRTKSVRQNKFQWWFHLPNVVISRINYIVTRSSFVNFSLLLQKHVLTKITRFWRATQNVNSPQFLSFSFTLGQTDCVHKRFHPISSRNISRSAEVGIWFFHVPTATWSGRAQAELHDFRTVAWVF